MKPISDPRQLRRFFMGYTEHAFIDDLGVADTQLVDYVAGLLVRFVHQDRIFALRSSQGRFHIAIAEMVEEVERSPHVGRERRELFRHIGDFSLFWTGVFPESVREGRRIKEDVESATEQGKRSYYVASTYRDTPEQADESKVLLTLSEEFETCAMGLRRARQLWEADRRQMEAESL